MTGARPGVVVTGAAVLNSVTDDLPGYAAALRAGRSGVAAHPELPRVATALLDGFSVSAWVERRLADDPGAAGRLLRAAERCALPAATAACVAVAAWRHAHLDPDHLDRGALIVAGNNLALGYQADAVRHFFEDPAQVKAAHILRHLDTDAVGAASQALGLHGEAFTVGAASASSAAAMVTGVRMVQAGFVDCCAVVGPAAELSCLEIAAFQASGAMAVLEPGEDAVMLSRPFDRARRGFVHGQGAAAVVLERRASAERRNATIHAEILGYGQRLDANRGAEPDPKGQAAAITSALRMAGLRPADVDYVNTHGTGSLRGDAAEAEALRAVFDQSRHTRPGPAVNSTKELVGHCLGAAGLQELIATALQIQGGFCHPNPNLDRPLDPDLAFVGRQAQDRDIRVALSNSVAFGGINICLAIGRGEGTT